MTKNQKISTAIMKRMECGLSVQEAFDAVIGHGAYEKLANELYEALKFEATRRPAKDGQCYAPVRLW